jgi:hypothetical protein
MMIAGCNEDLILSRCRCTSSLKDTFQDAKLAARRLMVEDEVVSLLPDSRTNHKSLHEKGLSKSQLSNIKFLRATLAAPLSHPQYQKNSDIGDQMLKKPLQQPPYPLPSFSP